jgi:hypothetical protein
MKFYKYPILVMIYKCINKLLEALIKNIHLDEIMNQFFHLYILLDFYIFQYFYF